MVDIGHPGTARYHAWFAGESGDLPEAAAFQRDGRSLILATANGALAEWNLRSARRPRQKHIAARGTPLIAPDARTIAWLSDSRTAVVTDLSRVLPLLGTLGGHGNALSAGAFSGDGKRLAIAGDDGTVTVYDLHRPVGLGDVLAHQDNQIRTTGTASAATAATATFVTGMSQIAASRDGRVLAAAGAASDRVWIAGDRRNTRIAGPLRAGGDRGGPVALSPEGGALAVVSTSSSEKSLLRVFNLARGEPAGTLHVFKGDIDDVAFGPDGRSVEVVDANGQVRRVSAGRMSTVGWRIPGYVTDTTSAAFSPDGRRLAVLDHQSGELSVWDAVTGKQLARRFSTMPPGEHRNAVAFAPSGDLIAAGGDRGTVSLWDGGGTPVGSAAHRTAGREHGVQPRRPAPRGRKPGGNVAAHRSRPAPVARRPDRRAW